ncbi:dCTP deaminase [Paenalkalicoccus suaedae]|uniref:dCTP deaminase, dUMP-forming n=1 Tax=Paenalkalicoccus suaedae TaxID=2592382 RepID=A0A859F9Q8_9BACI|nr:dCTP deaminase [Paenalkalicoccus suaedae]QKS69859.1 dCTP deaminase [Paenalkalicoccus suaedae]
MILSDQTIRDMMKSGALHISDVAEEQIQPASVDLTLGTSFRQIKARDGGALSLEDPVETEEIHGELMIVAPHSFLLATTQEVIQLPDNISAFVEGRSSIGRMGLFIQNAGWVDPGFKGEITLELYNANRVPIELQAGRRICQLVLAKMDRPATVPYRGKYQNQRGAMGSRIHLDRDTKRGS